MIVWVVLAGQATAGYLSAWHYRCLPQLGAETEVGADPPQAAEEGQDLGRVSIVIPTRNEERDLPALLASLKQLRYQNVEMVVVNDGSTDRTAEIAKSMGATVVSVDGPPPGWTGKNFACWAGAKLCHGEWLLFTDADTCHGPRSLDLALAEGVGHDLVSLLPRQRCMTFWERLLLPYAHALYFAGAFRVNRSHGRPLANGQYMLFRRSSYERLGGHEVVREVIVEDVALAKAVLEKGMSVRVLRADQHLEVRLYRGLGGLWEGLSKNAFRFLTASPPAGAATVLATIALGSSVPTALRVRSIRSATLLLITPAVCLAPWFRRFGTPVFLALLHPLAALVFQILALDSLRRSLSAGGTRWKGRRY